MNCDDRPMNFKFAQDISEIRQDIGSPLNSAFTHLKHKKIIRIKFGHSTFHFHLRELLCPILMNCDDSLMSLRIAQDIYEIRQEIGMP